MCDWIWILTSFTVNLLRSVSSCIKRNVRNCEFGSPGALHIFAYIVYLHSASLNHNLLSLWRDSSNRVDLILEQLGRFIDICNWYINTSRTQILTTHSTELTKVEIIEFLATPLYGNFHHCSLWRKRNCTQLNRTRICDVGGFWNFDLMNFNTQNSLCKAEANQHVIAFVQKQAGSIYNVDYQMLHSLYYSRQAGIFISEWICTFLISLSI